MPMMVIALAGIAVYLLALYLLTRRLRAENKAWNTLDWLADRRAVTATPTRKEPSHGLAQQQERQDRGVVPEEPGEGSRGRTTQVPRIGGRETGAGRDAARPPEEIAPSPHPTPRKNQLGIAGSKP